ncbi:hypothetical protein B9Q12_01145 [Candidatus Marsarchaeota G2 archaeon ECH_B_SAG-G06]|uniref:Uncharacterized protein n=1 Tax=Candidatus Marsarchaeota G2 archaeon ECH_B_SAG-G06 TaxID=1978166 RepID=A0A2R6C2G5_9ARCH|nr:MAG: hypothetical protein B9Q12_01145 [Candidatus Marsarchaeota G2 archaeon ECH_B_SAG-G06]
MSSSQRINTASSASIRKSSPKGNMPRISKPNTRTSMGKETLNLTLFTHLIAPKPRRSAPAIAVSVSTNSA